MEITINDITELSEIDMFDDERDELQELDELELEFEKEFNQNEYKHNYLLEPILNSELQLINNSKLLKKDKSLYADYTERINELREQYIKLEERSNSEKGLQKEKRIIRDELRLLSSKTYVNRDKELFAKMITTMINKIATRPQFSGYTYLDDMKGLAAQHILMYTWKFDPFRQSKITKQYVSAFTYISTIIFNAFIATINNFQKEQKKAKEQFLETQKLIHRDPNVSTYGDDYSIAKRTIKLVEVESLIENIKSIEINEDTIFIIPQDYKITEIDYNYILNHEYNISIQRLKD